MTLNRFFEVGDPMRMNVVAGKMIYAKQLPKVSDALRDALEAIAYLSQELNFLLVDPEGKPEAMTLEELQECAKVLKDDVSRDTIIKWLMRVSELNHQDNPETPLYTYKENEQVINGILAYIEAYCNSKDNTVAVNKLKEFLGYAPGEKSAEENIWDMLTQLF